MHENAAVIRLQFWVRGLGSISVSIWESKVFKFVLECKALYQRHFNTEVKHFDNQDNTKTVPLCDLQ